MLSGRVAMRVRVGGEEVVHDLGPGDVFHATDGDEHVAHPIGEAQVLVIERAGSV